MATWKYTRKGNAKGVDFANPTSITLDAAGIPTHINEVPVGGWKVCVGNGEMRPAPNKSVFLATDEISTDALCYLVIIKYDENKKPKSFSFASQKQNQFIPHYVDIPKDNS